MFGWTGNILRVDLSGQKVSEEKLDPTVARDYLGGRGLGIYYLSKELDPNCAPPVPRKHPRPGDRPADRDPRHPRRPGRWSPPNLR